MNLWSENKHADWKKIEQEKYSHYVPNATRKIEEEIENIKFDELKIHSDEQFFTFLKEKYYPWKYTDGRWLKNNLKHLEYYRDHMEELSLIRRALFSFTPSDIELGFKIAMLIKGLGTAGASGLLSILYPEHFGTVDQFAAVALNKTKTFERSFNPDKITLSDALDMERIMIVKANKLNHANNINYWTPRKVDKVLWTIGHPDKENERYFL